MSDYKSFLPHEQIDLVHRIEALEAENKRLREAALALADAVDAYELRPNTIVVIGRLFEAVTKVREACDE